MMSTPPTTQEEQPEIETVPETQHQDVESGPSQRKRAHRRKAPEEPREKPTQIPWSSEEQMALARAWLEMTEDPQEDPSRVRGEPSSKRSKTTSSSAGAQSMGSGSDARIHIDLNESEEEGETRETRETRFYRPGGRDAHKKAAHGSSSNKGLYSDEFEKLGSKLEGLMEVGALTPEKRRGHPFC
ncbi:hypothetical protein E3N88_35123 [Mikania micrantha]|uniref:Uncharacterized protein n=1 Tax=Mikania micrantha TaxID=192012 RepID=A0A5N6M2V6_9ASTR|nr:hypothetical protein E3N88_35123 [Mikania micrantha]